MTTITHVEGNNLVNTETGEVIGAGELFPGAQYDLPIPKLDGHRADIIRIAIGGGVDPDLMDEAALAYFASLKILTDVTVTVTATVVGNGWKASRNSEDEENVVNAVTLKVHSIDIPEATS